MQTIESGTKTLEYIHKGVWRPRRYPDYTGESVATWCKVWSTYAPWKIPSGCSHLGKPLETLYFGGGTPSLLPIDEPWLNNSNMFGRFRWRSICKLVCFQQGARLLTHAWINDANLCQNTHLLSFELVQHWLLNLTQFSLSLNPFGFKAMSKFL